MNKPITLCDRCKEYARCLLSYDGDNCRRNRTVKPTNADRIRAMSDKELFDFICMVAGNARCGLSPTYGWDSWLKQEAT